MRQALAGMLWSKQYYFFDLDAWLEGHGTHPLLGVSAPGARNAEWFHMVNDDVIAMPDKWEYPWYAAWDLAFHTIALSIVDLDFAKHQLELMLRDRLPAPQRSASGVRVELRRREPAGARLGGALHLSRGEGAQRHRRSALPAQSLQRAGAQLHLVAEPEGPLRAQRLRGRIPRPRQRRGVRSQQAAPHRRPARAGRRHRLDDPLLAEHARDRARAGRARPGLRGLGAALLRALHVGRRRDGPHRREQGRDVGRGGRLLLRRPQAPRRPRDASEGAIDGRPAAALRQHHARRGAAGALSAPARARAAIPQVPLRAGLEHRRARSPGRRGTPSAVGAERDASSGACSPTCSTRASS